MQNKTQQNSKKENSVKELNLDAIKKELKNRTDLNVKTERSVLYIYPDNLKTEQQRNSKEGKKFRSGLRRKLENHCNQILLFFAYDRIEELKKQIIEFRKFYKSHYHVNDLTVQSVSQSAKEKTANDLTQMFAIVKKFDAKKETSVKKEKIKKVKKEETPVETPVVE